MKHRWLFLAITLWLCCALSHLSITIYCTLILAVFHKRHFQQQALFLLILLGCVIRISFTFTIQQPTRDVFVVKEVKSKYVVLQQDYQKVIAYQLENVHPKDVVKLTGSYEIIDGVHNFSSFYFPEWCHRRHIYYSIQVKEAEVMEEGSGLAHAMYCHIQEKPEASRSLILEMLYGQRDTEASYFVSASGLHIVTLTMALKKLLRCFFEERSVDLIAFVCIGSLGMLTLFSPAILRVLCFSFVRFLCPHKERKDRLGMSVVLVLLIEPYMALEMSFLIPVIFQLVTVFSKRKTSKLLQSFLVLTPIQFFFLHQVSLVSIVMFRPLRIAYAICYAYAWLLVFLPISVMPILWFQQTLEIIVQQEPLVYYSAPIWWVLLYGNSLIRYLTLHKKRLFPLLLLLGYTQIQGYLNPFAQIYMIDVGQGDCTLIIYPFHQKVIMIDAMGSLYKDVPKDIILPFLRVQQIRHIDTLIVTHEDMDHSGGVEEIINALDVREVIDTKEKASAYAKHDLYFLNTEYNGKDENDNSIITFLKLYDTTLLLMGDAGVDAEAEVLRQYPKLAIDILKVGHHGSKTSSSTSFLHQLHPRLALISAGRGNRYHHPNQEVMDALNKEGAHALVTSRNGAVHIQICNFFAFYRTADNEFGIIEHR